MTNPRDRATFLVDEWLKSDFHADTRAEAVQLLLDSKFAEIEDRLSGKRRLEFGTAGLRARMGVGYDRMNTLTVMQTTQGLVSYLLEMDKVAEGSSVVIGFDGRYNSESFAHVTAAVFLAKGFIVNFISSPSPTPHNPFLIKKLNAVCGIQITASHNPKMDNGYKLFWSNGAQIIPPIDSGVAASIQANLDIWLEVFQVLDPKECRVIQTGPTLGRFLPLSDMVKESYCLAITADLQYALSKSLAPTAPAYKFCYTAMHGVGYIPFRKLFAAFGLDALCTVEPVASQVEIDPEFPTVPFPNPEEKGALKLAIAHAETTGCRMVLANDPDADRFTAAEKQLEDGSWYQFTGDEIGLLFADWVTDNYQNKSELQNASGLIVSSVVSSRMVGELCRVRSKGLGIFRYEDCLTGFKWIANRSIDLCGQVSDKTSSHSSSFVHLLGYEEAIGYQLSSLVPDKDGMSAACVWALMALYRNTIQNISLRQRLLDIQKNEIGFFVTNNGYYISKDPLVTQKIFHDFRNRYEANSCGISELAGWKIKRVRDVTRGTDTDTSASKLPTTPNAEMITIFFENGATVTVRASGTEPKVKFYSEFSSKVSVQDAKQQLAEIVSVVKTEFFRPHENTELAEQPCM